MLDERSIQCPYCWESFDTLLEPGEISHQVVVDCEVCCRPIEIRIDPAGAIEVRREND